MNKTNCKRREVVSLPSVTLSDEFYTKSLVISHSSQKLWLTLEAFIRSITVFVAGTKTEANFLTPKDPRKMRSTGRQGSRSSTPNIAAATAAGLSGTSSSSRCLSPCSSSCTPSSPVSFLLLLCSALFSEMFHPHLPSRRVQLRVGPEPRPAKVDGGGHRGLPHRALCLRLRARCGRAGWPRPPQPHREVRSIVMYLLKDLVNPQPIYQIQDQSC